MSKSDDIFLSYLYCTGCTYRIFLSWNPVYDTCCIDWSLSASGLPVYVPNRDWYEAQSNSREFDCDSCTKLYKERRFSGSTLFPETKIAPWLLPPQIRSLSGALETRFAIAGLTTQVYKGQNMGGIPIPLLRFSAFSDFRTLKVKRLCTSDAVQAMHRALEGTMRRHRRRQWGRHRRRSALMCVCCRGFPISLVFNREALYFRLAGTWDDHRASGWTPRWATCMFRSQLNSFSYFLLQLVTLVESFLRGLRINNTPHTMSQDLSTIAIVLFIFL